MTDELKKLESQERNAAKISTFSLIAAMIIMAAWGWTPLKEMIPALAILAPFFFLVVLSIVCAIARVIRGIQIRALKAKIADAG